MMFIVSAGMKRYLKDSMKDETAIKDTGGCIDDADNIKCEPFRETDNSRCIGLVMTRVWNGYKDGHTPHSDFWNKPTTA